MAVLKYMAGSASTTDRENGFMDTLKKDFPDVGLVEDRYGMDTVETALGRRRHAYPSQRTEWDFHF